jgi:hypothetical protein
VIEGERGGEREERITWEVIVEKHHEKSIRYFYGSVLCILLRVRSTLLLVGLGIAKHLLLR